MGWTEDYKAEMAKLAEQIAPYKVELEPGRSGDWVVEHFTVPEEPDMEALRCWRDGRPVPPGRYTRLGNPRETCFMTDTPAEMNDARELLWHAHGDILITGLGIGMVPRLLLREDLRCTLAMTTYPVTSVTIVELEQDVINLVAPALRGDERLEIVCADAFEWKPPEGRRFDWAWHDIWPAAPGPDEREDIKRLRSHYGRYMKRGNRQKVWLEHGDV